MDETKRLIRILNIELLIIIFFAALAASGALLGIAQREFFLLFLLFSIILIMISRKFIVPFTKKIILELTDRAKELESAKSALEESKTVLEIRVQARTRELSELAGTLESKVEERTKELKAKLEELEKFQRLTIGRELKMIELKKELKKHRKK